MASLNFDVEHAAAGDKDVGSFTKSAADILGDEARPIDPEVERRVLRKIDWFLMPAMVIGKVLISHLLMCLLRF